MELVQPNSAPSLDPTEQSETIAIAIVDPGTKTEPQTDFLEKSRRTITWKFLQDLSPAKRLLLYIILGSETSREHLFEQLEFRATFESEEFSSVELESSAEESSRTSPVQWVVVGMLVMLTMLFCGRTFAFLVDPQLACPAVGQQASPNTPSPSSSQAGG